MNLKDPKNEEQYGGQPKVSPPILVRKDNPAIDDAAGGEAEAGQHAVVRSPNALPFQEADSPPGGVLDHQGEAENIEQQPPPGRMAPAPERRNVWLFSYGSAFCLSLFIAAAALRLIYFFHPVPADKWHVFRVHEDALIAVGMLVLGAVVAGWVGFRQTFSRSLHLAHRLLVVAALTCCFVGVGWITLLALPEQAAFVNSEIILDTRQSAPFVVSAYFDNKSPHPRSEDIATVIQLFSSRPCASKKIEIVGYASSALFRGGKNKSDEKNKNLANDRSRNVFDILKKAGAEGEPFVWDEPKKMFSQRRYVDQTETGSRLIDRELLDRRVDISWCGP